MNTMAKGLERWNDEYGSRDGYGGIKCEYYGSRCEYGSRSERGGSRNERDGSRESLRDEYGSRDQWIRARKETGNSARLRLVRFPNSLHKREPDTRF